MSVKLAFRALRAESRAAMLDQALRKVAHHVGGDPEKPETVVVAAESLRVALNQAKGYQDIPRSHFDGETLPYGLVGR